MRERAAPIERLVAFFARVVLFHRVDAIHARVDAREQVGDQIVGLQTRRWRVARLVPRFTV
jgi:hypothetical protein